MTWDDFDTWSGRSRQGFAAQLVASGLLPVPEAEAYAARQFADLLPAGLVTPLHLFWTVRGPGRELLGHLWMRVRPLADEVEAYVFDVEVLPDARGRGLGRATMLAAEAEARARGATVMRLNVFGHNTVAMALYDSLGYVVSDADPADPASGLAVRAQRMGKLL